MVAGFDVAVFELLDVPVRAHGFMLLPLFMRMVDAMDGKPFRLHTTLIGEFPVDPYSVAPRYIRFTARNA